MLEFSAGFCEIVKNIAFHFICDFSISIFSFSPVLFVVDKTEAGSSGPLQDFYSTLRSPVIDEEEKAAVAAEPVHFPQQ